ncbi:MAG: branched-chain amino acid ABC transporter permease [Spirochaetota bacterium]
MSGTPTREQHGRSLSNAVKERPVLQFALLGVALLVVAVLPHIGIMRFSTMSVFAYTAIYTVVALGMNILLGFSGLISLGTAGFIGAGALGVGVFLQMGLSFELAAILTLIVAGALGALIGFFSLKVESIYLAIATLFIGEILRQIYTSVPLFGGEFINIGAVRLLGFPELNQIFQVHRSVLYSIVVVVLFIFMVLMYNLVSSRTGRALMAMSRSEHAAQAMGVKLLKYRLIAFVTATLYATSGGILYALYFQSAPTRAWTLNVSLLIIAMVVVGGFKSIVGTFLGAIIIYGLPNLFLKDLLGDISYVFSGVLIILVILFYPRGFVYVGHDLQNALRRLRTRAGRKS